MANLQMTPRFTERDSKLAFACARKQTRVPIEDDRTTSVPASPPERLPLASANIRFLSSIIAQLNELLSEQEDDDYGTLRANKAACRTASEFLTDAAIISATQYQGIIPNGCASTDAEGGIRIEWVRPTSGVRLVVPANSDSDAYIYHEVGNDFDTEPATAEALARWLREIK
jgi:hypothetical protein